MRELETLTIFDQTPVEIPSRQPETHILLVRCTQVRNFFWNLIRLVKRDKSQSLSENPLTQIVSVQNR